MIVGGSFQEQKLKECLDSVLPWVDGVYINLNGGEGIVPDMGDKVHIQQFAWEDDFAKARNQSFGMVPKDQYDWIMWIDSDDRLINGDKLQEMLNDVDPNVAGVFVRYQYQTDEAANVALIDQWRERFMRLDRPWAWHFPVHEVCHAPPGTVYTRRNEVYIQHFRETGMDDMATRRRNRKILALARQKEPNEPRHTYYLANEIYAEVFRRAVGSSVVLEPPDGMREMTDKELSETAIRLYQDFVKNTHANDDAYIANCHMAECYRMMGKLDTALDTDIQGIKLHPTWPKAYVGACKTLMEMRDWDRMEFWADAAIKLTKPPATTQVVEPADNEFHPYLLRGVAREEKKNYEDALKDYKHALELRPQNQQVIDKVAFLEDLVAARGHDNAEEIENLPRQQRLLYTGTVPQKSIAFLTRPHFEAWHPRLEESGGAGGAETCIMRVVPFFLANGWRVVVFGTPGYEGSDPMGCEWYNSSDWSPTEYFRVIVSSRAPEIFDARINADVKLLWMHDVNVGQEFMVGQWGDRSPNIDAVIALSEWHMNHLNKLYGLPKANMRRIPNGIDLSLFPIEAWEEKDPNRFIYSSSPDRGLDTVLQMWPYIRELNPKAELHVFYGWAGIDKLIERDPQSGQANFLTNFKQMIQYQVNDAGGEDGGIFWRDRVPQQELAVEQAKSSYWLYPTNFCIGSNTLVDLPRDYEKHPDGIPIKELAGKTNVPVWTFNEQTKTFELKKMKRCWRVGKRKVVKVTWDDGTSLRCTPDHRFLTYDRGWVEAQDLRLEESVRAFRSRVTTHGSPYVKVNPMGSGGIEWPREHRLLAELLFGEIPEGHHVHHVDGRTLNNSHENIQILSAEEHARTTFTGRKHTEVQIEARMNGAAEWRKENPEVVSELRSKSSRSFWDGMTPEEREEFVSRRAEKVREGRWNHKVVSVEYVGEEDVYDMEVEDNHNFIAGGVVVHNCETFCITACEMQAAGVIPITVSLAALKENIGVPETMIAPGHAGNTTFRNEYRDHIHKIISASEEQKADWRYRGRLMAEKRTWTDAYHHWANTLIGLDVL